MQTTRGTSPLSRSRITSAALLKFLLFLIPACLLPTCIFADDKQGTDPKYFFKEVATDGQGFVWAIDKDLSVLTGKTWKPVPVYFPESPENFAKHLAGSLTSDEFNFPVLLTSGCFESGRPMRLTRMHDGSMACVWQLQDKQLGVSQHTCAKVPVRTWTSHLHIFKIPEHFDIDALVIGRCPGAIENSGLRSPPFADSQGRLWIMGSTPDIYLAAPGKGVSRIYSIKPEQLLDDKSPMPVTILATEDGRGRIWLWPNSLLGGMNSKALRGMVIFDGDKAEQHETFTGIHGDRFTMVDRKDEKHMWVATAHEGIFTVDIDTMEATPLPEPEPGAFHWAQKIFSNNGNLYVTSAREGDNFLNSFWRLRDGKWTRLIATVDSRFSPYAQYTRDWFCVGKDIVMCAFDSAPWIIHEEAPPERLDWTRGYAIEDARHIFLLPDGSVFAQGTIGRIFHGKVSLEPKTRKPSRASELIFTHHGWTPDTDRNMWAVFSGKERILSQWDGQHWKEHPFPDELGKMFMLAIGADSLGRIWVFPNKGEEKILFFDSHSGEWKIFQKIAEALDATKDDPPKFIGGEKWYFDDLGRWKQPEAAAREKAKISTPEGCPVKSPDSIVIDNQGTYWLTSEGKLYRYSNGTSTEIFADGELNPFSCGRKILQAWIDRSGNAFLKTAFDKYIMITPDPAVAKPESNPGPESEKSAR